MVQSPTEGSAHSPAALIGPCLERIHHSASGRKYNKLRQDAKALLEKLDVLTRLQPPPAAAATPRAAQQPEAEPPAASTPAAAAASSRSEAGEGPQQQLEAPAPEATAATVGYGERSGALSEGVFSEGEGPLQPSASSAGEERPAVAVRMEEAEDGELRVRLSVAEEGTGESTAPESGSSPGDPGHTRVPHAEGAAAVTPALPPPPRRPRPEEMPARAGALTNQAAKELLAFLRDAVATRKPPVMELALDLIQKLISFKLLQGPVYSINHRRDSTGKPGKKGEEEEEGTPVDFEQLPPQAQALELVCRCDDVSDEAVELRLLKALLTAVTSSTLSVHGQALLLVVRACYNVFLTSRSDVNQATAKATLTQMLNVVFQRMEAGSVHVVVPPIMVQDVLGLPAAEGSTMSAFVQQFLHDVATSVDPWGTVAEGIQASLDDAFQQTPKEVDDYYDPSDPSDRQHIEWRQAPAGGGDSPGLTPEAGDSVNGTPARTGPLSPVSPGPASTAGGGELGLEAGGALSETTSAWGGQDGQATVATQLQKDAFLVFRALCKLSIRSNDTAPGSELTTIRGKLLALQLLKIMLSNSGPVFQNTERFITAIKQYLCLSLLKNCASQVPQAQRLCCSIFLTLMSTFRKNLKAEIGVFFPMIMLRPIEPAAGGAMPNAAGATGAVAVDIAHKTVVLQCVQQMCENGQLLVDLFVNYDCDLEGANLFERMITALVRIAQGSLSSDTTIQNPMEEQVLRFEALRCLVLALRSMTMWYNATVEMVAVAAAAQEAAAAEEQQQLTGLPTASAELADESIKSTWMETLASGTVGGDDKPPPGMLSPPSGITPSPSDSGLAGMDSEQKQAQMLENWKAFKRVFQEGVALFNKKPKKGISYLQEQKLIGASPADVARFLEKTQGLNKTMIGDYLGEREDFNLKVMHAYVDAMDFSALEFDEAIRKFLSGFRLPGEAQKIDRLMEKFAARYVTCNPESFKSADVGYVLAYSVIMLNTDAHNPMVKNKMSKQDFLRNNRGINDGGDLPAEFMEALYDRIINNEIKMKDDPIGPVGPAGQGAQAAASAGWLDTIMGVLGRAKPASSEPTEESIRRTHDYLREKAKGVTFFEARDGEAIRPMLDVAWAPMLGAFSVLFEEKEDEHFTGLCLNGIAQAVRLTCLLNMVMLRNTFVSSLARFTMLHSPAAMKLKSAWAFRALLRVADQNGNSLQECWSEVLRCVSRFELLQQATAGVPTDALLFAMPAEKESAASRLKHKLVRHKGEAEKDKEKDSFSSINDMGLHFIHRGGGGKDSGLPPPEVLLSVDPQEINRLFMNSAKLDSEAIVHFVRTMSSIAEEELRPVHSPRVFSLTKIVEISHFNMGRIRLVWSRIWAVLSDFFIGVGCHRNLQVAMYGVDSLRQLAMKFLERDELANYTFQNDFLRPFVVIMRHSKAVEIRELIIRCVSQMVLARVASVKSGWKTMFMVFTTAASDESPQIVRLAFDTIEKIVREYFHYITEVETTTFTDCVNCLIAYTNNPHSLDVSLNAIAFLRFCAMKLAEGDIGDVEELPEGTETVMNPNTFRIRPRGQDVPSTPSRGASREEAADSAGGTPITPSSGTRIRFTDKDEHMYFWFPLLAGLSELTFDPRPEIRYGALEVLFDILKFHGASFTPQFWTRVFDSVLLPIFDHVRAEVTDTTTFTDEKRRAEVDAWLYETCTRTLQHIVEIVVQFYSSVSSLLDRILDLLLGFIRRTHHALAAVGVAAMTRLILAAGAQMDEPTWLVVMNAFSTAVADTLPNVPDLIQHRMARRTISTEGPPEIADPGIQSPSVLRGQSASPTALAAAAGGSLEDRRPVWSLGEGAGARRLAEVKVRASIQLLVVQACGEVYAKNARHMPPQAAVMLLDVLRGIATHAGSIDADIGLRHSLLLAQAADEVPADRCLADPPLLRLEAEASQAYLSTLLHIMAAAPEPTRQACSVEARLVQLCMRNLERFEGQEMAAGSAEAVANGITTSHQEENAALAPLVVATLRAMLAFSPQAFRTHLKDFFPLLTNLISCEYAPLEVQKALSDLFSQRIGPMLG